MPLLNKRSFERYTIPPNLKPDDQVFYLKSTNEVFLRHEDYFNRMIELNSTIWSCKFTRKTGLTYAEAVESENNAANTLSVFPEYLEKPILFLVKQYSCRGRFEDLVNDCYYVMKDRFFISEEVTYSERSRKYPAKVVGVYVLPPIDHYPLVDQSQMKEPFLPAGDSYRYSVQILDGLPVTDDGLREGVSPDRLYRGKNVGARQKVKLFLKNSCVMPWPGTHYVVKPEKLSDGIVDGLYWNIVLSGMEPIFPRTPVLQRGRTPNCMKPGYVEPIKKTPKPKKEKPPSEKRQSTKRKLSEDVTDEVDDYDIDKMIVTPKRKTLSAEQLEKRKQKIEQQQKELEWFVSEAKRLNLDSSKIEQTEKLLTGKTIAMFKQKVKEAKDLEREKAKEEKKAKQREKSEYHKKRDDLQCDDLKPLPILPRLPLPTWLSEDDFSETLSVVQFFNAYQELLPLQEIRGTTEVKAMYEKIEKNKQREKEQKRTRKEKNLANNRGKDVNLPTKGRGTMNNFFRDYYVPWLLDCRTRVLMAAVFLVYLCVSIYGILVMEQGLDYDKLLLHSDPLVEALRREIELFHGGDQIEVAIQRAPNMLDEEQRQVLEMVVQRFENISYSIGAKGTSFWMREYLKYSNLTGSYLNDDRESWLIGPYEWSQLFAFYKLWSQDFVWANSTDYETLTLAAFRFRIGVHRLSTPTDLVLVTDELRRIADMYPQLDIVSYQQSRSIADQLNVILSSTITNDFLAMICMIAVALFFIPNPVCAIFIALAMVTIDIGVVGFLSLWSVKLDPISMITIIMSIGFSIEFSAHITHGYISNEKELSAFERCVDSMEKLAGPVIHGSISTILGVTILAFIDSYMVLVFFKTIFLVLVIGVWHALMLLPILLATLIPTHGKKSSVGGDNKKSAYVINLPVNVGL